MKNNNKVAVIAGLGGCFEALTQFRKELELNKISKVISLGNAVGLHYHPDSFLKLISDFILLSSNCEKCLSGEYPVLEVGAVGWHRIMKENQQRLSDTSKNFLKNLNYKYSYDDIVFFGIDHQREIDKVNFYFPMYYSQKPFIIENNGYDMTNLPLNEKLLIKSFYGKAIFPGLIYSYSEMGVSYYAIIDGNDIVFHQFTYQWRYDLNQITRNYGIIDPKEIDKYWNKYLKEIKPK